MPTPLPLIVLGGSDRHAAPLPEAAAGKHPLTGYKGVDVRLGGRPLIAVVAERFLASGSFGPVYVAGPPGVYRGFDLPAAVIPTDGSLGHNVRAALDWVREHHPGGRVGFTTCDILPDPADLQKVSERLAGDAPADVWFPLISMAGRGESLGASSWKPSYRFVVGPGGRTVRLLPGHLAVVRPEAIRRAFFDRVLDEGYGTRNRSVLLRRAVMIRNLLGALLMADMRSLAAGVRPTLVLTLGRVLAWGARGLAAGTLTQEQVEQLADPIFVDPGHRRSHPEWRMRLPILDAPSLALDIDTEEEARERGVEVAEG